MGVPWNFGQGFPDFSRERMIPFLFCCVIMIIVMFLHCGTHRSVRLSGRMKILESTVVVLISSVTLIQLLLSVFLVIYFYLADSDASYIWWYAMPWTILIVLITYWRASIVKLA